jgi:hypothetical protein
MAVVAIIAALAWRWNMRGLIPPLLLSPAILFLHHRYSRRDKRPPLLRRAALFYLAGSVALAAWYFPAHKFVFAGFLVIALLALLNSEFYIFLAEKRGIPFMLAAIPFHFLFHFYNGVSFVVGLIRYAFSAVKVERYEPRQ